MEEILSGSFSLTDIFLSANEFTSRMFGDKLEWITNRNKFYKNQQRFKTVKPLIFEEEPPKKKANIAVID